MPTLFKSDMNFLEMLRKEIETTNNYVFIHQEIFDSYGEISIRSSSDRQDRVDRKMASWS